MILREGLPEGFSRRFFLHLTVLLIAVVLWGCNSQRAAVDYARALVEAGEFERALEVLNRFDRQDNTPELDALRGRVLSLVPSTMVDGMFLMDQTVDKLDDPELRRDLFFFYLDTDQPLRAGQLVSGERLGPDLFFRKDVVLLRNGYKCLESPDVQKARHIRETLAEAKGEKNSLPASGLNEEADALALLCLGKGLKRMGGEVDPSWVFDPRGTAGVISRVGIASRATLMDLAKAFVETFTTGSERGRCEASARLFLVSKPGIPSREECQKKFPSSLVLHRVWPVSLAGLEPERSGPMLFSDGAFFPEYVPRPDEEEDEMEGPAEPVNPPAPPGR